MILNNSNSSTVQLNGQALPQADTFTYLGSTVSVDGGAATDIKQRLSKARVAFNNLQNILKFNLVSTLHASDQSYTTAVLYLVLKND